MELIPKEKLFRSENLVYDDRFVWTKLSWFNDILEIDRVTGQARAIPLPKEYDSGIFSFRSLNKRERTIFILPFRARELLLLNLDTEEYEKVLLPKEIFKEGETEGFTHSVIVGDYLIMFGYYPMFLYYHIPTKEFSVVDGIKERFDNDFNPPAWFTSWIEYEDKIYTHVLSTNAIVEIDVKNKSIGVHVLDEYDHIDGVSGIYNGALICPVFCENEMVLVRWNLLGDCKKVTLPFGKCQGLRPFSWVAIVRSKAYMISGTLNCSIVYDLDKREMMELPGVPSECVEYMSKTEIPLNYFAYVQMGKINYCTENKELMTIHPWSAKLVIIGNSLNDINSISIVLDDVSVKRLNHEQLKRWGENGLCINEKDVFGLNGFISYVLNTDRENNEVNDECD